jgi:long-subunit acyl-CoA synthetase (AMP-forming)
MRFMVTGMAPIKRSTLELLARMRLPLFETYGMIECGSIALNVPGAHRLGSVGRPLPGIEVELAADGEIVIHKEHTIACGYFQCADGEAERTFLPGNRIATGDIGRFDADGFLYLVGRKKEIIVTAGGEKVHPEALESEIDGCPLVGKSVVFAAPGVPSLCAVVLPKDPKDPAARPRIEQFVEAINARHPSTGIGRVVFTDVAFTRENGFLRPNLKLDRRRIAEHFRSAAGN